MGSIVQGTAACRLLEAHLELRGFRVTACGREHTTAATWLRPAWLNAAVGLLISEVLHEQVQRLAASVWSATLMELQRAGLKQGWKADHNIL